VNYPSNRTPYDRFQAVVVTATLILTAAFFGSPTAASRAPQPHTATVTIPRLGVSAKVFVGITERQFSRGFGHWPGTAGAGQQGNMVLSAHRTSGPRYLYNIDKLKKGDIVQIRQGRVVHRYQVTRSFIVKTSDVWIASQSRSSILTLFACHPKGSTDKRYVVRAKLLTEAR
jgi:sortase A